MNKTASTVSHLRAVEAKSQNKDLSEVTRGTAERYSVKGRNGFDSANIFLVSGQRNPDEHWGSISVISSFGELGYNFGNTGPQTFKQFLSTLNFQYLSEKLFAAQAKVFDLPKSIENIKKAVQEALKEGELSADSAQETYSALVEAKSSGLQDSCSFAFFLEPRCSDAFMNLELWSFFATQPNPQAVGFWEEIWMPFVKALREEVSVDHPKAA